MSNERIEVTYQGDGFVVRSRVSPEFATMAETVMKVMSDDGLAAEPDPATGMIGVEKGIDRLRRGESMWWGFSAATPRPVDGGFQLTSPDFFADPPEHADDLTPMLQTRDRMQRVCAEVAAFGPNTYATDRVILVRGWADHDNLVMIRDQPADGDSGWFVQPESARTTDDEWATDDLEALSAWMLLPTRPELVWAMNLPVGYAIHAVPGRIVGIVNPDDEKVAENIEF